jgi:hypothetical protein
MAARRRKFQGALRVADLGMVTHMDALAAVEDELAPALLPHSAHVADVDYNPTTAKMNLVIQVAAPWSDAHFGDVGHVVDSFRDKWAAEVTVFSEIKHAPRPVGPVETTVARVHRVFEVLSTAGLSRVVGPSRHS